jgi:hypothetical protein
VFHQYDSAILEVACTCRTASDTGRIVAVVATFRPKFNAYIGISPVNYFYDPVTAETYRYVILGLAGNHTIAATHAFAGINGHGISHD